MYLIITGFSVYEKVHERFAESSEKLFTTGGSLKLKILKIYGEWELVRDFLQKFMNRS